MKYLKISRLAMIFLLFFYSLSIQANPLLKEIENEIGGKLFLVHTLPSLSPTMNLIATFDPKGVHISDYGDRISGDSQTAVYFSINHHVDFQGGFGPDYNQYPYVVIIPIDDQSYDAIYQSVSSASFIEIALQGDFQLPKNSVIMYRKNIGPQNKFNSHFDILIPYINAGFKVIPFDDSYERDPKKFDSAKKHSTVHDVITHLGGLNIQIEHKSYFQKIVKDKKGKDINTVEFFEKIFPNKELSVGLDDHPFLNSQGEQWRTLRIMPGAYPANAFLDIGFSLYEYHQNILNNWMIRLNLPPFKLKEYLKKRFEVRIAARANSLVYSHFKNREKVKNYISSHLKNRNNLIFQNNFNQQVNQIFEHNKMNFEDVDRLAKIYCDIDYLRSFTDVGPIDTFDEIGLKYDLMAHLFVMNVSEAINFLNQYSKDSNIFNDSFFSDEDRERILNEVKATYAFFYFNNKHRTRPISINDQTLLLTMIPSSKGSYLSIHPILFPAILTFMDMTEEILNDWKKKRGDKNLSYSDYLNYLYDQFIENLKKPENKN